MSESNSSWVTLTPFGGANSVTGSCHLVRVNTRRGEKHYLVDCGAFSGKDGRRINMNISHLANKIDAVFITHAHIDHTGRLPYLYKLGYRGPIYATRAARELSKLMLLDSARIQEQDYKLLVKKLGLKNKRVMKGMGIEPLYSQDDAINVMDQFVDVKRGESIKVDDNLEVTFYNAGHALGSASIMLTVNNGEESYKLYFSGDIGQNNTILKRRKDIPKKDVDAVIMETTYAGRFQGDKVSTWQEVRKTISETIKKGGNVIFPTFAVGRTQEMLYLYYKDMMENSDEIAKVFRDTAVFVDSTLAVAATECFRKFKEEFNTPVRRLLKNKENNPFYFPQLTMISDAEGSKRVTAEENNYVVFSAAGMCNAGRVLYHLQKDLPNPNSTIIFSGFQADGTLGREIVSGAREVKIHGETVPIRAKIVFMNAFSAHVDQDGLVNWLSKISGNYTLFLSHGEPDRQLMFREELANKGVVSLDSVALMSYGKEYHIKKGGYDVSTFTKPVEHVLIDKDISISKKAKIDEIEKIIEYVRGIVADDFDPETMKLIYSLERRLKRDKTRLQKKKKQAKPNRVKRGRRK